MILGGGYSLFFNSFLELYKEDTKDLMTSLSAGRPLVIVQMPFMKHLVIIKNSSSVRFLDPSKSKI